MAWTSCSGPAPSASTRIRAICSPTSTRSAEGAEIEVCGCAPPQPRCCGVTSSHTTLRRRGLAAQRLAALVQRLEDVADVRDVEAERNRNADCADVQQP